MSKRGSLAFTLLGLGILVLCGGCVSSGSVSRSNLTYQDVQRNLIKGKTPQTEILKLFGAPDEMTKSPEGNLVWTYKRKTLDSSGAVNGSSAVPLAANSASAVQGANFDLVLTFNANEVLENYSMVAPQF